METAIDWLIKELDSLNPTQIEWHDAIEQAKEMYKDQIENAYIQGFCECDSTGVMDVDKYFKEAYGTK